MGSEGTFLDCQYVPGTQKHPQFGKYWQLIALIAIEHLGPSSNTDHPGPPSYEALLLTAGFQPGALGRWRPDRGLMRISHEDTISSASTFEVPVSGFLAVELETDIDRDGKRCCSVACAGNLICLPGTLYMLSLAASLALTFEVHFQIIK
jgi:hypothetical protein